MSDLPLGVMRTVPGLWYLASPYRAFPGGLDAAAREVCRAAALCIDSGINVYCPIAMTHPIAAYTETDPRAHDRWMGLDAEFFDPCVGICVVCMDGWRESQGVQEEIAAFRARNKPIVQLPWVSNPPANREGPKLLVIGDGEAGKDEFARLLHAEAGLTSLSSSEVAGDYVYRTQFRAWYPHARACWLDRRRHRETWKAAIEDYTRDDPARLAREIVESADVYVGMRSRREFEAARELFDAVVWIDRDVPRDSSNDLSRDDADVVVENNGTLDDLAERVRRIANLLRD